MRVPEPPGDPPLSGVGVLDLTDRFGVAGPRLLAALGARVLRPELPEGDPLRRQAPALQLYEGEAPTGLAHLLYNAGKRSLVVDWRTTDGKARLKTLMTGSDIVICSPGRATMDDLEMDPAEFAEEHPATALVLLDPFPPGSPFAGDLCEDLLLSATGGFAWLCGDADNVPEHPKGLMASTYAAIAAGLAGLTGLVARARQGRAGWFELSGQEAVAFSTAQTGDINEFAWYGRIPGRLSWSAVPHGGVFRCADDAWVSAVLFGGRFEQLIAWLQEEEIGCGFHSPQWLDYDYYFAHLRQLSDAFADLCLRHPAEHMVISGQQRMLMVMPVLAPDQVLLDPQLGEREMFTEVRDFPKKLKLPRAPLVFSRSHLPSPAPPTAPGSRDPEWMAAWMEKASESGRAHSGGQVRQGARALPLHGVRVADFGWMLVAPFATRFLADLGADVIRVESHLRRDLAREIGTQPPGWFTLDTNSHQHFSGNNKRSLALNLSHPRSVEIARKLIASSDVVVDNYRPGTMAKWGFSPPELLLEHPQLVVVTMPAVGSTGPHSHFGAIGTGVAAYGGVNMLTGFPGNPPRGVGPLVPDFFAPLFTVQGILAALHERERSGRGQYIDSSMLEATVWLLGTTILEGQLLGTSRERIGNREPGMSPHGIFPCAGEDEWIAIAIRSDAEWRAFCRIAPVAPGSAVRFARLPARKAAEDDLEELVADATRRRSKWEFARELQAVGVAAAPVQHVADHFQNDPGMVQRFCTTHHPFGVTFQVQNQFIRPEGQTVPNRRAPMLGEHSDEILGELGYDSDEITELFAAGAIR